MNAESLKNKVFIITGASEGIGRSLSLQLAKFGVRLAICARNQERLNSLKEDIQQLGSQAMVITADVTQQMDCQRIIDETVNHWGQIDYLVNNAGGTMWVRLDELEDLSLYEKLMQLNYLSCVHLTAYALPWLKKSQGLIVGISSTAGLTGVPCRTGYAATKHAVFGFFDSLRIELLGTGVDVLMVAPDFVQSEIHKRAIGKDGALGFNPLDQSKIMTVDTCTALILKAMTKRQRLLITSSRGKLVRWLRILLPNWVDKKAAKVIQAGKLG